MTENNTILLAHKMLGWKVTTTSGDVGGYDLSWATWMAYAHERGALTRSMRMFLIFRDEIDGHLVNCPKERFEFAIGFANDGMENDLYEGMLEFAKLRGEGIPNDHWDDPVNYPSLYMFHR